MHIPIPGLPGLSGLIADALYKAKAVKFGAFVLKKDRGNPDAVPSPYYFDCRGESHPSKPGPVPAWLIDVIAGQMLGLYDDEAIDTFEAVAAVPHGATPYAEVIARLLGVPLIRLTKRENPDGTTTVDGIEGDVESVLWKRVLLVEDVVTTAASSAEAITVLARDRIFCTDAVCVVDREQGGTLRLEAMNVQLRSFFAFTALVGHYRARGTIDAAKYDESHAYHAASVAAPAPSP